MAVSLDDIKNAHTELTEEQIIEMVLWNLYGGDATPDTDKSLKYLYFYDWIPGETEYIVITSTTPEGTQRWSDGPPRWSINNIVMYIIAHEVDFTMVQHIEGIAQTEKDAFTKHPTGLFFAKLDARHPKLNEELISE